MKLFTMLGIYLVALFISSVNSNCFNENLTETPKGAEELLASELPPNSKLEFTLDMFHRLYEKDENLFFSPVSIYEALQLAFFGAAEETETQLRSALRLGNVSKSAIVKEFKMNKFYEETTKSDQSFKTANKIYFSKDEPVRSCVEEIFKSEIEKVDFRENATERINAWVEDKTNGKIKEIIGKGDVDENTRVTLVNSAYFKGTWENQFKKSSTKLGLFYVNKSQVVPVMMMNQKGAFRFGISEALKSYILELPYDGNMSLIICLPPFVENSLQETIKRLTWENIQSAMDDMFLSDSIEVSLPKFKLSQSLELKKALKKLNITDMFDESKADLSGFSEKKGLSFGEAKHKAVIEVNEEGAEAAAATALIGTRSGREQSRFLVNHPFIFFLWDKVSIPFIGAVHNIKMEK